jgi:hypothetical protein
MKALPTEFTYNGLLYRIVERSATRYFAELQTTDTGVIIAYETGRITQRKANEAIIAGKVTRFEASEHMAGNEAFGFDKFECAMPPKNRAIVYQNYMQGKSYDAEKDTVPQQGSKLPCSDEENKKVVPMSHPVKYNNSAKVCVVQMEFRFP